MIAAVDPLSKLVIALTWIIALSFCERPITLAIVAGALLALLFIGERVAFRRFLRALLPFAFFALSTAWIYAVAPNPAYVTSTEGGWAVGALVGSRTMTIGLVTIAFAVTTDIADLARALVERARLPKRFVFGALAAIQFMPALTEDARIARMIARAAVSQPGASRARRALREFFAGLKPGIGLILLAGAVRRAGAAAVSMELRGLSAASPPLVWRVPRFQLRDAIFACAAMVFLIAAWMAGS